MNSHAAKSIWLYAGCIAFDKVFSLVTIPLMAAYAAPSAYGDYELVISLCMFVVVFSTLGSGDTLIRFASGKNEAQQKEYVANLLGSLFVFAFAFGTIVQFLAAPAAEALGIQSGMWALRWTLLSSSVAGFIELPLVWLRFRDQPKIFFWFTVLRTVAHVLATWCALALGHGIEGVIVLNAWVALGFASVLIGWMMLDTGVSWSMDVIRNVFVYSLPLVGGALALFSIGTMNRWFLSNAVSLEEIGLFGLSMRLAMATSVLPIPLILWWFPKRIAALSSPEGRNLCAQVWGYGMATILLSAVGLVLLGPAILHFLFPKSYAGALAYLPGSVLVVATSLTALFCTGGVLARSDGFGVQAIDGAGAIICVVLLYFLVPPYGVQGALMSMVSAHTARTLLFHFVGQRVARVAYPTFGIFLASLVGLLAIWLAPDETAIMARIAWTAITALGIIAILHRTGAAPISFGIAGVGRA